MMARMVLRVGAMATSRVMNRIFHWAQSRLRKPWEWLVEVRVTCMANWPEKVPVMVEDWPEARMPTAHT